MSIAMLRNGKEFVKVAMKGILGVAILTGWLVFSLAEEPTSSTLPTPAAEAQVSSGEVQERRVPGLLPPGSSILTTPTGPVPLELAYPTFAGETPSCTSWGADRFDCFVRGHDGIMYHAWWAGGPPWSDWEYRGGALASKPSCVSWGANRLDCFARFSDNAMHHTWWDGSQWHSWESLGGVFSSSDPKCISWGTQRLDCFARGNDGQMYHNWFDGKGTTVGLGTPVGIRGWGNWDPLGGVFSTADPTCVSWGARRLDCFARGNGGALYHKWFDGNGWGGWESLGGILTSNPSCVSWGANRLDCFARSTDNAMHHIYFDGRGWGGAWESLGGQLESNPSCASWGANRLDCFAQGTDINVWHKWFNGAWLGWEPLGRVVLAPYRSPADIHCYLPPRPRFQPAFSAAQTILETTFPNPPPPPSINLSSPTWARDVVQGRGMYDITYKNLVLDQDPLPGSPTFSSRGYSQNEWTQILALNQDYEVDLVGLSGRAIIYDGDKNNGQSGADMPFTHPFGTDWEFYIAPDDMYKKLAAPPAPPAIAHCEYAESVIQAKRDFGLDVVNTLGVETDGRLLPEPYRPKHGDRVAVWGRWIVDTGHSDFHTEIHPPLLLATGRATSPDQTTMTVIGRPYLVGQRWHDCRVIPPPRNTPTPPQKVCTDNGLFDHLFEEGSKLGVGSLQVEAHPTIMPKVWNGTFNVVYTVKPPTPRMSPQDRLMVSFRFMVRTGVTVQLSSYTDTVEVRIGMNSNLHKTAPLPQPIQYRVFEKDLKKINPDEAGQIGNLYDWEYAMRFLNSLGIGDVFLRTEGILTTRFNGPLEPLLSGEVITVPVNSVHTSPAIPAFTINDNQPWPIAGTMFLTWERH